MNSTIAVPTEYGTMLVNRYDINQTQSYTMTGRAIDHAEIEQIAQFIEPGTDAVDAGTCFGAWTLGFAKRARRVHSFEAQRKVYLQLCGTLAINDIDNVFPRNVALGASYGKVQVPVFADARPIQVGGVFIGERTVQGEQGEPTRYETVRREKLDGIVHTVGEDFAPISVIKIDVEGMEVEVLRGAALTILKHRPVLYVETLITGQPAVEEAFEKMSWHKDFPTNYSFVTCGANVLCLPNDKWDVRKTDEENFKITRRVAKE